MVLSFSLHPLSFAFSQTTGAAPLNPHPLKPSQIGIYFKNVPTLPPPADATAALCRYCSTTIHLQAPAVQMSLITPQYLWVNTPAGEWWDREVFSLQPFSIYDQRLQLNKTSPPAIKERNHLLCVCVCLPAVDSGGTVVLVSQDGIQRPPLRFPRGGHLLQFLSCLENGLLPHGQLDPPLWSQRGKVGQNRTVHLCKNTDMYNRHSPRKKGSTKSASSDQ